MFPINYKKEYTPFSSSVIATAQNERGTIELAINMLDVRSKEVEIECEEYQIESYSDTISGTGDLYIEEREIIYR